MGQIYHSFSTNGTVLYAQYIVEGRGHDIGADKKHNGNSNYH